MERELEIIGEAARRVSRDFQAAQADLPWRQIIGQRNVLAHDYGEINPELIWNVVTPSGWPRARDRAANVRALDPGEVLKA